MTLKIQGLTKMQSAFVGHYIISENATDAARKAGYAPANAHREGWKVLTKPQVAAAIQAERDRLRAEHRITADRVIEEVTKIALAEIGTNGVKGSDKVAALTLLMRKFGQLVDKTEITGKDGAPIATITADATPEQAAEAYKNLLQ